MSFFSSPLHVPFFILSFLQRRSQCEHLYLDLSEIWTNCMDFMAGRALGQGSAGAGPVRDVDVLEDMYRSTMEQVTILVSLLFLHPPPPSIICDSFSMLVSVLFGKVDCNVFFKMCCSSKVCLNYKWVTEYRQHYACTGKYFKILCQQST